MDLGLVWVVQIRTFGTLWASLWIIFEDLILGTPSIDHSRYLLISMIYCTSSEKVFLYFAHRETWGSINFCLAAWDLMIHHFDFLAELFHPIAECGVSVLIYIYIFYIMSFFKENRVRFSLTMSNLQYFCMTFFLWLDIIYWKNWIYVHQHGS